MSEGLPDDAWANAFQTAAAKPLLTALQRRLHASTNHVNSLAELLHERSVIEQEYSAKLLKLARAADAGQLGGKGGIEWERNGGEARLWNTVVSDLTESDFEQPVRDLPNKMTAWRRIGDQESSLERALKDYEKVSVKLDKASSKSKSSKAEQLQHELSQLTSQLNQLTPATYSTFQRLDEERLRALKEIVVRWATLRGDMATKSGERAETAVASILGWEPTDEVISVGNRLSRAHNGSEVRASPSTPSGGAAGAGSLSVESTPNRRASMQSPPAPDFGPRSGSLSNGSGQTPTQSGFSGLKSMLARKATVRNRSGSEATSVYSGRRAQQSEPAFAALGEDTVRPTSRQQVQREFSDQNTPTKAQSPPVDAEGFSIAPADRHRNPWDEPTEESPSHSSNHHGAAAAAATGAGVALPSAIFASQRTESPTPVHNDRASTIDSISSDQTHPRLNLALSSAPIEETEEQRQAALAKMQQTLRMPPPAPNRRSTITRGRRDARNTMQASAAEHPIPQAHMAALARMGEEEQLAESQGTVTSSSQPARRLSSSSMTSASSRNPFDSPGLQAANRQPADNIEKQIPGVPSQNGQQALSSERVAPSGAAAAGVAAGLGAGALAVGATSGHQSGNVVASPTSAVNGSQATSASVQSGATAVQPKASQSQVTIQDGLNATIIETVDTLMHQYAAQQIAITGEIHLTLSTPPPPGTSTSIRLTEFDALESVSPNPAFLAQVPDSPGEYYLNTDLLAQTTSSPEAGPHGPVLFTYQVLVPQGQENAMSPVGLNPAFQAKEGETRMIFHYRANAPVQNLGLSAIFPADPSVSTTQSKPVSATWAPSAESPDLTVASWAAPVPQVGSEGKIIARFFTAPGQKLVPSGVDARFVIPNHLASGLGIETTSADGEEKVLSFNNVIRTTVSGRYVGDVTLNP
ncbi:hypothetical protein A1Q1_04936 [Trichosporon asahii var. asahii CBS 2479]|uniref:MHD domain-containing protein n=1 Tax=Trichosporon asahii var. asahii (strain ATCC 90039 / CBS 2479 / JCM 2466 / KCTC 7840 / NBRC 103889/ NCYC 2677 / UAMH 7654) TaxID=1186058 RepID=J6EUI2_TRIAS|nr:hypothetical protein A1Q1_04936 [Trichosporon asahii var. asahii CBS 2479]EJT46447.1 hypothetical protein A1Q1_04936 [Trichosporon asahii var. asahii CBS 2479]